MEVDLDARVATFRVIYAGPEGATKFLNLRNLHRATRGRSSPEMTVLHAQGDRVVAFPFSPRSEPPLGGLRVEFRAVGMPGRLNARASQMLLLSMADAVVFLPDRGEPLSPPTTGAFKTLLEDLRRVGREPSDLPILVQDYRDADPRLEPRHLAGEESGLDLRFIPVHGDTEAAVQTVFDEARQIVLDRYRRLEEGVPLETARERLADVASRAEEAARKVSVHDPRSAERRLKLLLWLLVGLAAVAATAISLSV